MTNIGSASSAEQRAAYILRVERILRFMGRQQLKKEWVRLSDLAGQYGRKHSIDEGYERLIESIQSGTFDVDGRSRLLYLHPATCFAKMTRERLDDVSRWGIDRQSMISAYVAPCWAPSDLAAKWLQSYQLHSPPKQTKARRGRPIGATRYNDAPAIKRAAELIPILGSAHEATKAVIAELGLTPGHEHGASEGAIKQRIRIPALAMARANGFRG